MQGRGDASFAPSLVAAAQAASHAHEAEKLLEARQAAEVAMTTLQKEKQQVMKIILPAAQLPSLILICPVCSSVQAAKAQIQEAACLQGNVAELQAQLTSR